MRCFTELFTMDDNVVRMMPKGREQVLRSAQGVHNSSSVLCMMFCAHWVRIFLRLLRSYINNGAHLASATVPWHWLCFCPAPKFGVYFGCLIKKNLKGPKWHWLILDPMGALVDKRIVSTIYG